MSDDRRGIALIGFMATGKTTIGFYLARILDWEFLDTDSIIEEMSGMSISEIFNQKGESYFRSMEVDVVRDVCNRNFAVISFGGGAPLNDLNAALIRKSSTVVLLQASFDTLIQRGAGNGLRPLIAGPVLGIRERMAELHDARKEAYEKLAHLVVDTDNKSPEQIATEIILRLGV